MKKTLLTGFCLFLAIFLMAGCNKESKKQGDDVSVQATDKLKNKEVKEVAKEAEEKVNKTVPDNLIQCPDEIFSNMSSCMDLPDDKVCGYDHTIYDNGKTADHGVDYRTPCHYCNFFGEDLEKEMMGTKVQALGYTKGECE